MTTVTHEKLDIPGFYLEQHPDLQLNLQQADIAETMIIHLCGVIDTYNSDFFRSQAFKVVDAGYKNIIVDATGASYMSSTGIGAFTSLLKRVHQSGGDLMIYGLPEKIYEVFQLLGFSSFFMLLPSLDDALEALVTGSMPTKVFPREIACPVCRQRLRAVKSGRFRCSSCKVILAVDTHGQVLLG